MSITPHTIGEAFAFFRAHCLTYDGSDCEGVASSYCLLWTYDWRNGQHRHASYRNRTDETNVTLENK